MWDPNNEENNPEVEQEKFEEEKERNEDETSDYYSFDNIRNMALRSSTVVRLIRIIQSTKMGAII